MEDPKTKIVSFIIKYTLNLHDVNFRSLSSSIMWLWLLDRSAHVRAFGDDLRVL